MIFTLNNPSRLSTDMPTVRVTTLISRKPEPVKVAPTKPARPVTASKTNPKWALITGIGD